MSMENNKKDPLQELFKSKDYKQGYDAGYRAGEDSMMNEMAGDYEVGYEDGQKKGMGDAKKYVSNVSKIANQWNIREITAESAIQKIFNYVHQKAKKLANHKDK